MRFGPVAVALDEDVERRVAVKLHGAVRWQLGEARLVVAAEEVRLGHERPPGGEQPAHEQEHQRIDGAPEALRPLDVADAERVEQRLLDLVLLDERQLEAHRQGARQRRLARRGHARDDDQERRPHPSRRVRTRSSVPGSTPASRR